MKKKKEAKVLITGGSGYIGSCLAAYLSKAYSVTTIDKKKRSVFSDNKHAHFIVDLKNKEKLNKILDSIKPKFIVHLAGQSTIDMVDKEKKQYYNDNYVATKNLLDVIEKLRIPNLIFSSTAAVYKKKNNKIDEKSRIYSQNSYGISKINCENIIKKINPNNAKYCILRFFNVSSSFVKKKIGEFHNPETHLIPIVINSIFKKKNIRIYGDNYKTQDGTCHRDYIHILDIMTAIEKSIQYLSKKKNKSNIFNLGSGKCYSVIDIINSAFQATQLKTKLQFEKNRKFDVSYLLCDINKAKKKLKWKPKFSNLQKIIKDEVWWYKYLNKNKKKRNFLY
jgi:UDP-glucose 4-epimerase